MTKDRYSTFDAVKILNINRNTLQSALAGDFIVPDIKRADGRSERSEFSTEGLYTANLFFYMIRCGWPRRKAKEDAKISWSNVGAGKDQYRYYVRTEKTVEHQNLRNLVGWKLCSELPGGMKDNEVMRWEINLIEIKNQVDSGVKQA